VEVVTAYLNLAQEVTEYRMAITELVTPSHPPDKTDFKPDSTLGRTASRPTARGRLAPCSLHHRCTHSSAVDFPAVARPAIAH
jgi:hypothetical protein